MEPTKILGISAFYHDSAAVLIDNGHILGAAQEERFTRKKHDASFPVNAIKYLIEEFGLQADDLYAVCFYEKPYIKFERLLETYHGFAPKGLRSFLMAMPVWIKEKLFLRSVIKNELKAIGLSNGGLRLVFPEHHLSHAASAFYPSPFDEGAIITIDGVGEWATTTIGRGNRENIEILREIHFPHSLGLLYSAFTYYCGFRVNSGEYKLMGLAPYGDPDDPQTLEWKSVIKEQLIDIREDGSFLLNMPYFQYATGLKMCHEAKWEKLFGIPKREPESELTRPYMNMAIAIQQVTEEIVLKLAATARDLTNCRNLVLAGGVALNCVANGKLLRESIFSDVWIQPASGDAGGALGAALACWHIAKGEKRITQKNTDNMKGAYLGPNFSDNDIIRMARRFGAIYNKINDFDELCRLIAVQIADEKVVGWFQGRMEYGPRALGNRSIIGDPRSPAMQKKINLKIKYREGFRPFAPSVLEEDIKTYFDLDCPTPYMLLVAPVNKKRQISLPEGYNQMDLYDRLYFLRSDIPAITHVDYSARIQSVNRHTNPRYWQLIKAFKEITGYGLVVNTSFNVRGEPIVCSPQDAYLCFMNTEMDWLVIGNYVFEKRVQPPLPKDLQAKFDAD